MVLTEDSRLDLPGKVFEKRAIQQRFGGLSGVFMAYHTLRECMGEDGCKEASCTRHE